MAGLEELIDTLKSKFTRSGGEQSVHDMYIEKTNEIIGVLNERVGNRSLDPYKAAEIIDVITEERRKENPDFEMLDDWYEKIVVGQKESDAGYEDWKKEQLVEKASTADWVKGEGDNFYEDKIIRDEYGNNDFVAGHAQDIEGNIVPYMSSDPTSKQWNQDNITGYLMENKEQVGSGGVEDLVETMSLEEKEQPAYASGGVVAFANGGEDTRFGGMMEMANSPAAQDDFVQEFKEFQSSGYDSDSASDTVKAYEEFKQGKADEELEEIIKSKDETKNKYEAGQGTGDRYENALQWLLKNKGDHKFIKNMFNPDGTMKKNYGDITYGKNGEILNIDFTEQGKGTINYFAGDLNKSDYVRKIAGFKEEMETDPYKKEAYKKAIPFAGVGDFFSKGGLFGNLISQAFDKGRDAAQKSYDYLSNTGLGGDALDITTDIGQLIAQPFKEPLRLGNQMAYDTITSPIKTAAQKLGIIDSDDTEGVAGVDVNQGYSGLHYPSLASNNQSTGSMDSIYGDYSPVYDKHLSSTGKPINFGMIDDLSDRELYEMRSKLQGRGSYDKMTDTDVALQHNINPEWAQKYNFGINMPAAIMPPSDWEAIPPGAQQHIKDNLDEVGYFDRYNPYPQYFEGMADGGGLFPQFTENDPLLNTVQKTPLSILKRNDGGITSL